LGGLELRMQQGSLAIQAILPRKDVYTGTALVFFGQSLGGTVFISVAQSIFASKLGEYLGDVKGVDASAIVKYGATWLRHLVPTELLPQVLDAFSRALAKTFYVSLATCCVANFGALGMEWRSIEKGEGQGEKKSKNGIEDVKV
jgi:hypothetical protein